MDLTRREFARQAAGAGLMVALPAWRPVGAGAQGDRQLRELARAVRGPVLAPGDAGYARAKRLFDPEFDRIRPLAVLRATSAADVQEAVRWAARHDVRITARSGGHSYGGYSTVRGGLVVDLSRRRAIALDRNNTRARIEPGAQLGAVYARLARAGVTIPAGTCPSVGLGGLALGGGVGLAGRRLGLTCDRVTALTIVTADGRRRRIDAESDEDLFWACRGGGGGNFGIVTSLTLRTAPARRAAYFFASWPGGQAAEALDAWLRFAPETDDRLTSILSLSTGPSVRALGQFMGEPGELRSLLGPLANAGASLTVGADDYVAVQRRWAGGTARTRFAAKSDYLARPLSAAGRRAALNAVARGPVSLLFDAYGGALNRPGRTDTAFVHRDQLCSIQYYAGSEGPVRRAHRLMRRHVSGEAYQNYIDPELGGWRRAYYAENLERLRAVREAVDPDRVFRFAQGI
jgi:FAD/FMN-containing dehydrogenase